MKQIIIGAALIVLMAGVSSAAAEEEANDAEAATGPFSLDASVGLFSDYMFRGLQSYDGTSIQPSLNAAYDTGAGTISANLWMHISGESNSSKDKFTELDTTVKYSIPVDIATLSIGNVWYTYPGNDLDINNSAEVFASVSLDTVLTPTFTFFQDYRDTDAQYYELTFSQKVETDALGKGFATTPYVTLGFGSNSERVYHDNGLEQITIGTSFDLTLGDFAVTPNINYTFKIDDNTVDQLWFGLTFGYSI